MPRPTGRVAADKVYFCLLEEIAQALSRLGRGSYGVCVQCGRPIDPERLAVLPDTTKCVDCAQGIWLKRKGPEAISLK